MSTRVKEHIQAMVNTLNKGDPVLAERHFREALKAKISDGMEARKRQVAGRLFGTKAK